ncbi:MAG: hypothetical protein QM783_01375 [Phycisphaerales bacterium]
MTTFASTGSGQRSVATATVVALQWRFVQNGNAVLTVCVNTAGAVATLHRSDADEVVASAGPTAVEQVDGLEHVSVPGVLTATLRRSPGGIVELLYARTPLLEMLKVPGGCAEPPELVRVEEQSGK